MNKSDNTQAPSNSNDRFSAEKFDEMDELALSLQKQIQDLDNIPDLDKYNDETSINFNHSSSQQNPYQTTEEPTESLSEMRTESLQKQLENQLQNQILEPDPALKNSTNRFKTYFSSINVLILSVIGLFFIVSLSTYLLFDNSVEEAINTTDKLTLSLPEKPISMLEDDVLMEAVVESDASISTETALVNESSLSVDGSQKVGESSSNELDNKNFKEEAELYSDDNENTIIANTQLADNLVTPIRKIPLIYINEVSSSNEDIKQIIQTEVEQDITEIVVNETLKVDAQKGNIEIIPQIENKPIEVNFEHNSKEKLISTNALLSEKELMVTVSPIVNKIIPSPVIGNSKRQWIDIIGTNFSYQTRLSVTWKDKSKLRSKEFKVGDSNSQLKFMSNKHLRLHINTGVNEKIWQLKLKNKNLSSIDYHFKVVKPFVKTKKDNKASNITENKKVGSKVENQSKAYSQSYYQYIKNKADNFYTLQLLASSNQDAIKSIVNKHQGYKELYWYQSQRDGKNWTVLMYGNYSSKQKALDAYKKLPKSLASSKKPWAREIKAVKAQVIDQGNIKKTIKSDAKNSSSKNTKKNKGGQSQLESKPKLKENSSGKKLKSLSSKSIYVSSLNDNKWTFQLISLSNESSIIDYIKRNKLAAQAYYFERVVNGKKRYTLIYGSYRSKQQAENELRNLPASIRQGRPWIRSYADIKKLMGSLKE